MASFPPPLSEQQTKRFRDLYSSMDNKISPAINALNHRDHHTPVLCSVQVDGLPPAPVQERNGMDLLWNTGVEPKNKRPKVQDFLENSNSKSQISSLEFLQALPVSTGLGLSLEPTSALLGLVADDLDYELKRQDAETDRYIKFQGEQLRQAILGEVRATQLQIISYLEGKVLQKLREKEVEAEVVNKKNMELEMQIERLSAEANAWQQQANHSENVINTLKINLQQMYAQTKDIKEGFGDSEVNDPTLCFDNLQQQANHVLCKDSSEMKKLIKCKFCRVNEVCMLLLPCKHLCLCKECEGKLSICPLCQSSKHMAMEVRIWYIV